MQQSSFSTQDSLRLIDRMIQEAKNRISEDGSLYLVWGWSILGCALLHFAAQYGQWLQRPYWVWALTFLPWAYMMLYLRKREKQSRVKTYADEINSQVWVVFVVVMLLTGFIIGYFGYFQIMYPVCLVLYGIPTYISGVVLRFSPLRLGAVCCWLLAVASAFVPPVFQVLLLAVAVAFAWIVPGYLLRRKYVAQNSPEHV